MFLFAPLVSNFLKLISSEFFLCMGSALHFCGFFAFDHTLFCFGSYWFERTFEVSGNRYWPGFGLRSAILCPQL